MRSEVPDQIGAFERAAAEADEVTYYSADRRAKVECTLVQTAQGEVWHCELFDAKDEAHGWKQRNTSAIARSVAEFGEVISELATERR